jgi:hypothetical protein
LPNYVYYDEHLHEDFPAALCQSQYNLSNDTNTLIVSSPCLPEPWYISLDQVRASAVEIAANISSVITCVTHEPYQFYDHHADTFGWVCLGFGVVCFFLVPLYLYLANQLGYELQPTGEFKGKEVRTGDDLRGVLRQVRKNNPMVRELVVLNEIPKLGRYLDMLSKALHQFGPHAHMTTLDICANRLTAEGSQRPSISLIT